MSDLREDLPSPAPYLAPALRPYIVQMRVNATAVLAALAQAAEHLHPLHPRPVKTCRHCNPRRYAATHRPPVPWAADYRRKTRRRNRR